MDREWNSFRRNILFGQPGGKGIISSLSSSKVIFGCYEKNLRYIQSIIHGMRVVFFSANLALLSYPSFFMTKAGLNEAKPNTR